MSWANVGVGAVFVITVNTDDFALRELWSDAGCVWSLWILIVIDTSYSVILPAKLSDDTAHAVIVSMQSSNLAAHA